MSKEAMYNFPLNANAPVVYSNQGMGALHTVCWLKSTFSGFCHKRKKEEKGRKTYKKSHSKHLKFL